MPLPKPGPLYTDRRRPVYGRSTALRGVPTPYGDGSRWLTIIGLGACACAWVWMLGGEQLLDGVTEAVADPSPPPAVLAAKPAAGNPAGATRSTLAKSGPRVTSAGKAQGQERAAKSVASTTDKAGKARSQSTPNGVKAAGPNTASVPRPIGPKPTPRPVAESLLRAGQDAVARRVIAVWGSVADLDSMRGAAVDLVDRGLALHDFKLREAIIRHRTRDPRRYKRASKPRTVVAWRRALNWRSLRAFLDAFAARLPTDPNHVDAAVWMPGDIVYVKPSPRRARLMPAIVSDRTDDDGVSLLITLDPRDKVALELHSLDDYPIRHHYRLDDKLLKRARARLGM